MPRKDMHVPREPGVVLVTSGQEQPTLLQELQMPTWIRYPGCVQRSGNQRALGRDSFQEVDIAGITMPITKHNYIVKDAERLPHIIREAFDIARRASRACGG